LKFATEWRYELGLAIDAEDNNVDVVVTYEGRIGSLMSYTSSNNLFVIPRDGTGPNDQGSYKVKMTLTDDYTDIPKSTEYEFIITIVDNPEWIDPDEEIFEEPPDYKEIEYEWA